LEILSRATEGAFAQIFALQSAALSTSAGHLSPHLKGNLEPK